MLNVKNYSGCDFKVAVIRTHTRVIFTDRLTSSECAIKHVYPGFTSRLYGLCVRVCACVFQDHCENT